MPRICLIGDSHLAALKRGWSRLQSQFPGMTLTFFAMEAGLLRLDVSGGKLVAPDERVRKRLANTSEGDGDIVPDYDAYVLCGLSLGSMKAFRAYLAERAGAREAGRAYGKTVEDIAQAMAPALRDTIACDVAAKLRQLTEAPIFLVATPLPAYERLAAQWERLERLNARIAEAYDAVCHRIAEGLAATFIPQPAETVNAEGLTTRSRFYLLPPEQVAKEVTLHTHMNSDFGAIVLGDALRKIEARLSRL